MRDKAIFDEANDRWNILLGSGRLLTWRDREWAGAAATVGAETITQDDGGNILTTVSFPSKVEAEIGIELLSLYRTFRQNVDKMRNKRREHAEA